MENNTIELIRQKPDRKITYSEYINSLLYTADTGYYMNNKEKIGKQGDFYTTSNLSDAFGCTLARWLLHVIHEYSIPPVLCEIGGGTGRLAQSILTYIKNNDPAIYNILQYSIVDISPFQRQKQIAALSGFDNVLFIETLASLPVMRGIIFSNELFDALPVHVIEEKQGMLFEVMITEKEGKLAEVFEPLENLEILRFLQQQNISLNEGQRFEVPLEMVSYLESIAGHLQEGFLVTIDYGYTNNQWMEAAHKKGSLRGYFNHQMIENVLLYPAQMDITSHIHFDALTHYGAEFGLKSEELLGQQEFLLQAGILEELRDHSGADPFSETAKRNRAIRDLVVPGGISSYFRVLLQSRGISEIDSLFPKK
ncbi:class I SAM-dependent methyltransferase [Peribacillus cavernae]|nr:SAM-dependent methyltransferase [Peribacillus cavernae]MDQ0218321.1 SAM-dependent MidA family methyltransferase [Peribacillus cavernae]